MAYVKDFIPCGKREKCKKFTDLKGRVMNV